MADLPAELTTFIGRRQEIAQAKQLLRRHRLLTLTGGAGVGKTRLALRIAGQLANKFPDGTRFVELAALEDRRFLPQTVANVLGVQDLSPRPTQEVLEEFLADKDLLLVLDNCEHMVEACAVLADRLLAGAPRLRILATSRHTLRAAGEHVLEVPPLPVPDPPSTPARNEAMRLFADRAAAAHPGFTVDARNRDTVARLCRRLEGIPLAIELAAVRVRALPVKQILARLENSYFDVLAEGSRVTLPPTQTLRAAIDWSFNLCSDQEQRLWARASVFCGAFDLDAAEHVCSGTGIADEDVLELVAGLVEKSILIRADHDRGGAARYRMLEALRQYGAQLLASSDEETVVRTRHRDHYAHLAERVDQEWLGPHELEWFTRLWQDHANLRAALEFCLAEPGQGRTALEIAGCLWLYWTVSGRHTEARHWLGQALSLDPEPSPARARALWGNGWFALLQADWAESRSSLAECHALAERLGDRAALAQYTRTLATAAFFEEDISRALTLFEDAIEAMEAVGDRSGLWFTLIQLMVPNGALGKVDGVGDRGEQCLSLVAPEGAPIARSWSLWVQGLAQWWVGDERAADELTREALRIGQASIDRWGAAHCLEMLAWVAAARHDSARAARLFGAAHTLWRSTGTPPAELNHIAPKHKLGKQRAHSELGNETFNALFDEGARFTDDEAVTYALAAPHDVS